jgi:hypothetical protein
MSTRWSGVLCGVAALLVSQPSFAALGGKLDVGIKAQFGLGGEYNIEIQNQESDDDAEATVGFALFAQYEVFRYIDIGLLFGFNWLATEGMDDGNVDANAAIDIDALLKLKYPFMDGRFEIYLAVPIGLTIVVPSDDYEKLFNVKPETGIGMNVSVLPGISYRFWGGLGAFLELGWVFRMAKHGFKGADAELEFNVSQFALNFGLTYTF